MKRPILALSSLIAFALPVHAESPSLRPALPASHSDPARCLRELRKFQQSSQIELARNRVPSISAVIASCDIPGSMTMETAMQHLNPGPALVFQRLTYDRLAYCYAKGTGYTLNCP